MSEKNKILKSIKINNGTLTYEDRNGTFGWYRNGKKLDVSKYKYYDKSIGAHKVLTDYGSIYVHTPYYDKLAADARDNRKAVANQHFNFGDKHITLRTKGKMNLATIPYNMLDSIAINTGRSNTNIKDNLGLIGKESTFGGISIPIMNRAVKEHPEYFRKDDLENGKYNPVGKTIDPSDLVNNHAYFTNKYFDYIGAINRKFPYADNKEEEDRRAVLREKMAKDAYENNRFVERTPHYHENILADAFARFAANPAEYNPGQDNYVEMQKAIGDEVFYEPQVQHWWNTEGKSYYNKGLSERRRLESAGKKSK
jgi:hypothetical protein